MGVGQRVKQLRKIVMLKAIEVDRLTGRAKGTTALLEARDSDVLAGTAVMYAATFGCSLDWLIMGVGSAPTDDQIRAAVAKSEVGAARKRKRERRAGRPGRASGGKDEAPPSGGRRRAKRSERPQAAA